MPNRYSHASVLSHYQSQGVISIPTSFVSDPPPSRSPLNGSLLPSRTEDTSPLDSPPGLCSSSSGSSGAPSPELRSQPLRHSASSSVVTQIYSPQTWNVSEHHCSIDGNDFQANDRVESAKPTALHCKLNKYGESAGTASGLFSTTIRPGLARIVIQEVDTKTTVKSVAPRPRRRRKDEEKVIARSSDPRLRRSRSYKRLNLEDHNPVQDLPTDPQFASSFSRSRKLERARTSSPDQTRGTRKKQDATRYTIVDAVLPDDTAQSIKTNFNLTPWKYRNASLSPKLRSRPKHINGPELGHSRTRSLSQESNVRVCSHRDSIYDVRFWEESNKISDDPMNPPPSQLRASSQESVSQSLTKTSPDLNIVPWERDASFHGKDTTPSNNSQAPCNPRQPKQPQSIEEKLSQQTRPRSQSQDTILFTSHPSHPLPRHTHPTISSTTTNHDHPIPPQTHHLPSSFPPPHQSSTSPDIPLVDNPTFPFPNQDLLSLSTSTIDDVVAFDKIGVDVTIRSDSPDEAEPPPIALRRKR
ncbi:MAG: hypothetical protein Q9190_002978 [Brigantiaea leucoxantha]